MDGAHFPSWQKKENLFLLQLLRLSSAALLNNLIVHEGRGMVAWMSYSVSPKDVLWECEGVFAQMWSLLSSAFHGLGQALDASDSQLQGYSGGS